MKLKQGFALLALATTIAVAAAKWDAAHVTEVRFRDGVPGKQIGVVSDPKAIEELLGCFSRAVEIKTTGKPDWSKCIDLLGERPERGRWLYDSTSGEFSRLDPKQQRIYRFPEADRARVNSHFEKKD